MKEVTNNSTQTFEPEVISDTCKVEFTKVTNSAGVTINGKIIKDGVQAGNISMDGESFLVVSLKPRTAFSADEVTAIFTNVPGYIAELTAEK